ncbi:MAG: hypothetical protein HYT62_03490 [Candidatus Yanofskybacteria bacterium]|nr:hypothetical protein [Candidatus Yanofskybacteria bacterium]
MAKKQNLTEGFLSVDFDEITRIFADLRPTVLKVATVEEFVAMIQKATNIIFLKYFEFPQSRLYKPEELGFVVQHVMDCINNITPAHIPYESISVNGKWMLRPLSDEEKSAPKQKPS